MKNRLQIGLLALLLAFTFAGPAAAQLVNRPIVASYDLDATSYTYVLFDDASRPPLDGSLITTAGLSSATITAVSGAPFADVAVNAQLEILTLAGTLETRYVLTRASAVSITVNAVITIPATGYAFRFRNLIAGTGSGAGWFNVSKYRDKLWTFQLDQVNVTGGVDFQVQCRAPGPTAKPKIIYPPSGGTGACGTGNYTAAATACWHGDNLPWHECRVGLKIGTNDDGGDTGANLEQITVDFSGERRQ